MMSSLLLQLGDVDDGQRGPGFHEITDVRLQLFDVTGNLRSNFGLVVRVDGGRLSRRSRDILLDDRNRFHGDRRRGGRVGRGRLVAQPRQATPPSSSGCSVPKTP